MAALLEKHESQEVERRAAEIRRRWSARERVRRAGLPPDIPARLRQFLLGESQTEWVVAVCRPPGGRSA